jgi:hypothetical protein
MARIVGGLLIIGLVALLVVSQWDVIRGWGEGLLHQKKEDTPPSGQRWTNKLFPDADKDFAQLIKPGAVISPTRDPIDWSKPHVAVYSVPALAAPRWRPTVRDLTDSGQAHAIDLLVKDPSKGSTVWSALQASMMDPKEFSADKDPLQLERVFVATVTKGTDWLPGDRMQWTRVLVQPINFSFAGYTIASTDSDTVKVHSVDDTNSRKVSADIGLTIPGVEGPKVSLTPSSEHTVKTTSDVNVQYERLGVDIMPGFLRIIRESEAGNDVVGNTLVNLSVTTDPSLIKATDPKERDLDVPQTQVLDDPQKPASDESQKPALDEPQKPALDDPQKRVFDEPKTREILDAMQKFLGSALFNGKNWICGHMSYQCDDDAVVLLVTSSVLEDGAVGLEEKKASISVSPQRPIPHCPLIANVWMLYEQRRIDKGWEFYEESKQDVAFVRKADPPRTVEVVSADDVSPAVWSIQIMPPLEAPRSNIIHLLGARADASSSYRELVFTDFRQASAVARWERTHAGRTVSNLTFNYPAEGGSLVPIRKKGSECLETSTRVVDQPNQAASAPKKNPTSLGAVHGADALRNRRESIHSGPHGGARLSAAIKPLAWRSRNHAFQTITYR